MLRKLVCMMCLVLCGWGIRETNAGEDGGKKGQRPESAVVLIAVDEGVLPLACYDAERGAFLSSDTCHQLLPVGTELRTGDGSNVTITGDVSVQCEPLGGQERGFSVDGKLTFGEWAYLSSRPVSPVPDSTREQVVTGDELDALVTAVKVKAPELDRTAIAVLQVVDVDVDGDGKNERLYSVVSPGPIRDEPAFHYNFSGVLMLDESKVSVLFSSQLLRYEILATSDLDGDGSGELLVYSEYYEGLAYDLIHIVGGKAKSLGGWGCGA